MATRQVFQIFYGVRTFYKDLSRRGRGNAAAKSQFSFLMSILLTLTTLGRFVHCPKEVWFSTPFLCFKMVKFIFFSVSLKSHVVSVASVVQRVSVTCLWFPRFLGSDLNGRSRRLRPPVQLALPTWKTRARNLRQSSLHVNTPSRNDQNDQPRSPGFRIRFRILSRTL